MLAVLGQAAAEMNRYPDFASTRLVRALADRFTVPVEDVAVGTGSVGVAQQLVQAVAGDGDEVVFAWRSFEAYPIISRVDGASAVTVPLTADDRHDLPAMAAALTDRTRLVFVCNPNNPTGTAVRGDELDAFLAAVPRDVLVVLDEAYREFGRDPLVPDGLDLYRTHPNVCVLRTFSKAYGLAALRVGFVVAHADIAGAVRHDEAHPQASEAVGLERAQHADVGVRAVQVQAVRDERVPTELAVGLVRASRGTAASVGSSPRTRPSRSGCWGCRRTRAGCGRSAPPPSPAGRAGESAVSGTVTALAPSTRLMIGYASNDRHAKRPRHRHHNCTRSGRPRPIRVQTATSSTGTANRSASARTSPGRGEVRVAVHLGGRLPSTAR